jgi:hypothetical protein
LLDSISILNPLFRSLVDELKANLDSSGQHGGDVGSPQRREECFLKFLAGKGKAKNMLTFMLFLLWDGVDVKFSSRRLPAGFNATSTGQGDFY